MSYDAILQEFELMPWSVFIRNENIFTRDIRYRLAYQSIQKYKERENGFNRKIIPRTKNDPIPLHTSGAK